MALTNDQIFKARTEAMEFLEYSVYVLALHLNVEMQDLSSEYVIPVQVDDPQYSLYLSLTRQVTALEVAQNEVPD
jgi:hypothetical protein